MVSITPRSDRVDPGLPALYSRATMADSPLGPHQATPLELRERILAERRGRPFLIFRDGGGVQRIVELSGDRERLSIGRSPECDLCLAWDPEVSRLHAELERVGAQWLIADDGVSRNGTRVGRERVSGRQRLSDGDMIIVGATAIAYRQPGADAVVTTRMSGQTDLAAHVTDAQRRVLVALCRPFKGGVSDAVPATNPQIATELYLSVAAVKTHMRALFHAFEIDDLPPQEKRRRLVALAFATGLVSDRDL
jgi:pSer/pThr/pTyr-binding forkhead associated (FHA) protein